MYMIAIYVLRKRRSCWYLLEADREQEKQCECSCITIQCKSQLGALGKNHSNILTPAVPRLSPFITAAPNTFLCRFSGRHLTTCCCSAWHVSSNSKIARKDWLVPIPTPILRNLQHENLSSLSFPLAHCAETAIGPRVTIRTSGRITKGDSARPFTWGARSPVKPAFFCRWWLAGVEHPHPRA